jgi:hypothetical protein
MMFNKQEPIEIAEDGLKEALRNFRSSVHAWSEAEFVRPRTVLLAEQHRTWRRAAVWALGCVLAAGTLSAGIYEHHSHDQFARLAQRITAQRMAAQQAARQNQLAAKQDAAQNQAEGAAQAPGADEKLMAAVDQDVSQQVPSAMEPLAQLMDEGANH